MDDVLELSSDSDKTILLCPDAQLTNYPTEKNMYDLDFSDEETAHPFKNEIPTRNEKLPDTDLLQKLYNKYIPSDKKTGHENSGTFSRVDSNNSIDLTSSPERNEDDDGFFNEYEAMQTEKSGESSSKTPGINFRKRELEILLSDSTDEEPCMKKISESEHIRGKERVNSEQSQKNGKGKKLSRNASDTKQQQENAKALKILERNEKKKQLEREKALKAAAKSIQKSMSPEECLKNIIVTIDQDILQQVYGDTIKDHLRNNQISFKSMPKSNGLISWTRKIQTLTDMMCKETEKEEKHYLTIISSKEFDKLTKNQSLRNHIQSIKAISHFQHLTIIIYGKDKPSAGQELAIMEINMFFKCYFQFAKRPEDLALMITITTKSVAQIPYKLEKEEKYKLQNEFFNDCNRDSVRVDKNGNGLGRLWHQMLTMFPLARLETAEAITAVYPTPTSLFKAYEDDSTKGEELIQNLNIRRAYGPLASSRKVGPELSKKCHNFFTSQENILL
ncbi:unnamed protein product [Phaedon cochleariae]|uniref:Crossover junction endonuclease EME1 n=1 Tax=Phaedon cochleariae TaxID=80249 RepID=A0A9P0DLX7_PHACE|nr:unnamed protein product [Phaedon cochleariae]